MLTKTFIALGALVPITFIGMGTKQIYDQQHRIASYLPVSANVVDRKVEVRVSQGRRGRKSYSYTPVVTYRYEVSGQRYTSSRVTPLNSHHGRDWAEGIIALYRPGAACQAFYDPDEPAEAFLIPHVSFSPYFLIVFPMVFLAIGAWAVFGGVIRWGRSTPAPLPRADGWFEVRPVASIGRRVLVWTYTAAGWSCVGALAFGHYFYWSLRPYEGIAIVIACVYGAVAVGLAIPAVYLRLVQRHVTEAKVLINRQLISCGGQVDVRVGQGMLAPLTVQELKVGLVCEALTVEGHGRHRSYKTVVCHEDWMTLAEDHGARVREVLSGTCTFDVPEGVSASSPSSFKGYPFYRWRLRVITRMADSPDYRGDFAIFVTGAETVDARGDFAAEA